MIRLSVQDYDCSESESIENQHHVARYVMEGDGKVTHPAETSFLRKDLDQVWSLEVGTSL